VSSYNSQNAVTTIIIYNVIIIIIMFRIVVRGTDTPVQEIDGDVCLCASAVCPCDENSDEKFYFVN